MPLLDSDDRDAVEVVAQLLDCNPFLPERVELERRVLRDAFVPYGPIWHSVGDAYISNPNTPILRQRVEKLAATFRERLAQGATGSIAEFDAYRGLVMYLLWLRYEDELYELIEPAGIANLAQYAVPFYDRFARDAHELLDRVPGPEIDVAHLFAVAYQARRAFHHIFRKIFGGSRPAAELRALIWKAIFSKDLARYRNARFTQMHDIPVLIIGESGTGKDLVARAIAYSQFIPFNPGTRTFACDPRTSYHATNITAFNSSTVESALFGHRRGAFTGADDDHQGWFEVCGPHGTIFLDEIGDLDPSIQVKLLRVVQNRELQRMGESLVRRFSGKIVTATHHDLEEDIRAGRFRADLYYRLRGVRIHTPSLRAQLADRPDDLYNLALIAARNMLAADESEQAAAEAVAWITKDLGADYHWPNNMRELELVVRDVAIVGHHEVTRADPSLGLRLGHHLAEQMLRCELSADAVRQRYIEYVLAGSDNYREAARRLGVDRRTVATVAKQRALRANAANGSPDADDEIDSITPIDAS